VPASGKGAAQRGKGASEGVAKAKKGAKKATAAAPAKDGGGQQGDGGKKRKKGGDGGGEKKEPRGASIKAVARDGKVTLESKQQRTKRRKKGYLDVRKERQQEKKIRKRQMEEDEDADLQYDHRRFFDEVAYEPPKLAMEKSKKFYKNSTR